MTAEERLRRIHAILVDNAVEVLDCNGAVIGYAARFNEEMYRELYNLSNYREGK